MNINFPQLEKPISLNEDSFTILAVENKQILSQILFSLSRQTDYFKIFDDNYKDCSSRSIVILNPLDFSVDDRKIIKILYDKIISQMNQDVEFKQEIENEYVRFCDKIYDFAVMNNDLEFNYNEDLTVSDAFKSMKLTISQDDADDIAGVVRGILKVMRELSFGELIIFSGLTTLLNQEEYSLILEQCKLDRENVLFLENSENVATETPHLLLDKDFVLFDENGKMIV